VQLQHRIGIVLGLPLAAIALPAAARDEPLWEAGIGIAGGHFPHYRGSDQSRGFVFPIPYGVYHGEVFKADREGVRSIFVKTDSVDVNLSVGASLPVDSEDNRAREGMPSLRPSIEAGPSVQLTMWRSQSQRVKLDARFPLRFALSVEARPQFVGTQFFPHLNLDIRGPAGMQDWNLGLLAGPVFTDRHYNRYFYEVPAEFATASRPAYQPGSGFAGMQYLAALSKRFAKLWVGGFVRYDTLGGAAFEASPLVTSKRYLAAGLGVSWIFAESARRVTVDDRP
jgi:outer membrane scaffolding protein for murein synthesis (MipA/OmpV family)